MFDVLRCCRCKEPVRLPDTSTIWVRCPHCSSEYPIEQIHSNLPPALEAIAPPSLNDTDALAEGELAANQPIELDLSGGTASSSMAGNTTTGSSLIAMPHPKVVVDDEVKAHVRTPDTLRAERKKQAVRRNRQANGGILKVVLGGIAGLMLGQLILWWLPGEYRTDPMQLAPKLPAQLAFLAPDSLRGSEVNLLQSIDHTNTPPNNSSDTLEEPSPEPLAVEPTGKPNASNVLLGPTDTPSFNIQELNESLAKAKAADAEFSKGFNWDLPALNRWYSPIRELAHCVTYANMTEPDIQEFASATRQFVRKLATDRRKRVAIGDLSYVDINNASHERKGIVVTGTIDEITEAGHFFSTKLRSTGKSGEIVNVLSRVDPRKDLKFAEGNEIVILGVVVADPSLYLLGYNGDEEAVVYGGLPYKIE